MKAGKILSSAMLGTTAMTLFSYLVSESKNINFREPDILKQLIKRMPKGISKDTAQLAGWIAHYGVGFVFDVIFAEIWKRYKLKPSLPSGAVLGLLSGIIGVGSWKTVFKVHPNPPAKNLNKYFGHLILAHIIYGIFSALAYKLARKDKNSSLE